MSTIQIDRITLSPKRYQRVARRPIGAFWFAGDKAWMLFFAAPAQVRVTAFGKTHTVNMQARGMLVLDAQTTSLVPYAHLGDFSDYSGGGAFDIDPYGEDAPIERLWRSTQRCPWGRFDLQTGKMIVTPVADYNLSGHAQLKPYLAPAWPLGFDGEHFVRWIKWWVLHRGHSAAEAIGMMALENARLFWEPYGKAVLQGPANHGHGYVGRSWAWTAYLASFLDPEFAAFMASVAKHCIDPVTGSPQRLHKGEFYGSPDPWGVPPNGSGVPANVDVFQGLEADHQILAFQSLGMNAEAVKLADTVLPYPKAKWIDCATGLGIGSHGPDFEQCWIGLGALARIDKDKAVAYAKRWPVMRPVGGSIAGPYQTLPEIRAALKAWGKIGTTRAFLECTGGVT